MLVIGILIDGPCYYWDGDNFGACNRITRYLLINLHFAQVRSAPVSGRVTRAEISVKIPLLSWRSFWRGLKIIRACKAFGGHFCIQVIRVVQRREIADGGKNMLHYCYFAACFERWEGGGGVIYFCEFICSRLHLIPCRIFD